MTYTEVSFTGQTLAIAGAFEAVGNIDPLSARRIEVGPLDRMRLQAKICGILPGRFRLKMPDKCGRLSSRGVSRWTSVSGSYLLDTNIVIAFFSGEPAVIDKFDQADEILLPSIVLGELIFGARKSQPGNGKPGAD